ncbi:helix-turn-helix domain-containing protein [Carnobacterium maltaromaticum]|uniref:Helix-turn-helix domain-containing protein n=1 Tax=Carnobacterium maltaromaticum TaxID=2751 RepID=A0AAW9JVR0_CARML|nr:helix-turn-helix domain-containing protein [Carnobacterium maltaromaticum]KRN62745.1 hypothetical protein IV70_GL003452 [Carnobacterium maltaromaticum DSM 20342]MDZ5759384.1 helix-turn-helix domain-containing protein [Carnobacterium maltaromaticum]
MNIQFDKMGTKQFFEWFATKIMEIMMPKLLGMMKEQLDTDELLTAKEVTDRILKCCDKTAQAHFLNRKGFPYLDFGEKGRRYPKKAVEEWIVKNTKLN